MGLLFTTSLLLNITLFCHIFSTYTLLNKELSLTSSQHIEPKFQLVKAANHIRNTINNEIQSFDDNFQVRFIIFIFFIKKYIYLSKIKIKIGNLGGAPPSWEAAATTTVMVWSRDGSQRPSTTVVGLIFLLIIIIKNEFLLLFIIVTKLIFVNSQKILHDINFCL